MDALNRLQFHIMQDEMREHWNNFRHSCYTFFTRHKNRVGVSLAEVGHESEGRVWVEVGSEGLRLRVTHLHPADPSVAEALKRKCAERREAQRMGKEESILTGKLIYPPQDDKISLSSLEDYWFNHWQGPYITADTNQNSYNLPKLRRSHRKSKRSSRCSICHKKLVKADSEESGEGQCVEREENVLPHMTSVVKLDARVLKEDDDKSDEEISKPAASDDTLSRCSASEEQQARMHRVLDHELRTSYSLFANDVVSQDVLDAFVGKDMKEIIPHPSNLRYPPLSPRQSRSCPCSPKLSGRTYSSSPESIANSPKSRSSFVGTSQKFSLSSSLLALHRQASNTLMPEFLKFDSGKSESPGTSKHNSLKSECRKIRHTLTESILSESAHVSSVAEDCGELTQNAKSCLSESQSLPSMKLTRMSLTYRSDVVISEEKETSVGEEGPSLRVTSVAEEGPSLRGTSVAEEGPVLRVTSVAEGPWLKVTSVAEEGPLLRVTSVAEEGPSLNQTIVAEEGHSQKISEVHTPSHSTPSVYHNLSSADRETATSISEGADRPWNVGLPDVVPANSSERWLATQTVSSATASASGVINLGFDGMEESSDFTEVGLESDEEMDKEDICAGASSSSSLETKTTKKNVSLSQNSSRPSEAVASSPHTAETLVVQNPEEAPTPGGKVHPVFPEPTSEGAQQQYNTFIEKDVMQEAREMVFWWRRTRPADEESEFCLHHAECKVMQKPLLIFLHGIGSSADVWSQQLWYFLSCGYEVVAPDLLGHGLSSAPKNRKFYSFSRMLDYISLVFDLFVPQGRKCIVVGHNYGCALAVALARGRPSSVGLVILAGSGGPSPLVPHNKYENSLGSTLTRILNPLISCGCLSRELLYTPRGKHYPVVFSDETGVCSTPKYVLEYTSQGQHWPEGDLAFHRRISIPALLLYGMKDSYVSFVEMCEMEKTIPRAFLELIPGAGHELMTDRAEEVCHAMHRFIRRWKQNI